MSGKAWAVFAIIIAAIFGGVIWNNNQARLDISDIGKEASLTIRQAEERNGNIGDRIKGNPQAKVLLVEYGDFQCGPCRSVHPDIKAVVDKYPKDVALVYRNFPIGTSHPNARAAAAAAEAAGQQGKYWEMHDLIYDKQDEWSSAQASDRNAIFSGYAKQLGLNEQQFADDMAKPEISKKINFDMALARLNQVQGTPTIYLNGEQLKLTNTTSISTAVEEALKKHGVAVESTTKTE